MKKLNLTPMLPAAIVAALPLLFCPATPAPVAAETQEDLTDAERALKLAAGLIPGGQEEAEFEQEEYSAGPAPSAADALKAAPASNDSGVEVQRPKPVVIDWKDRNRGAPEKPYWLAPLVLGNTDGVRSAYNIPPEDVVKFTVVTNPKLEYAQTQAKLLFAEKIASELKQYVLTAAAQSLDQDQMDIVEITTVTKIDTAGLGVVAYDFWQLVETTDPTNNIKTREYVYYLIYRIPWRNWSDTVRKILH